MDGNAVNLITRVPVLTAPLLLSLECCSLMGCGLSNINHLLDPTESNIRFVLPGQVMLGEAKLK